MAVTHSTAADGTFSAPGTTAWDADHAVADNSFVAAKLSASATDVLFGRDTAGAGAGEEVPFSTFLTPAQGDAAYDALGAAAAAEAASQPLDADLTAIAGLSSADSNFIVGSAAGWVVESGATARASLGAQTIVKFSNQGHNPADATTYFIGNIVSGTGIGISFFEVEVLQPVTIKAAYLSVLVTGTNGSNETGTWSIRVNDTTDTTISAAVTWSGGTTVANFDNEALNISLSGGDRFAIKFVTPTFATNPTNVFYELKVAGQ